ncbi:MAG: HEAT repeat domain-containing protein [Cyanobium sp. CZS 48M]|nr:HEAT repeat domain-containing protein [Cyanobium sp. CZS48M]
MQQVLPAAAALLLLFWLLRRRSIPRPSLDGVRAIAVINRAQLERVVRPVASAAATAPAAPAAPEAAGAAGVTPWPADPEPGGRLDPHRRQRLLADLRTAAAGREDERLAALAACLAWGDRASLPLLRRARFDPDPRVAALAAEGIAAFRGRTTLPAASPQPAGLPRNVVRTR